MQQAAPVDWHQAAIQYLELEAAARDLTRDSETSSQGKRLAEVLEVIEHLLRFESNQAPNAGGRFHSPSQFDPDDYRRKLLDLLDQPTAVQAQTDGKPTDHPASVTQET